MSLLNSPLVKAGARALMRMLFRVNITGDPAVLPKVSMAILSRRQIPMPKLPSAKQRRRRAGELMRRILLDMLVATRPQRTLFEAFLDAKETFGHYRIIPELVYEWR